MNIAEISEKYKVYTYSDVASPDFVIPGHSSFRMSTAGVAHTRSLTFLKQHLHGPYFDLEQIWNEHTYYEFGDRSVEKTMATMVQEPYVNHVPTVRDHKQCGCLGITSLINSDDWRNWTGAFE